MNTISIDDKELIQHIYQGGEMRLKAIDLVYKRNKNNTAIADFVRHNKGSRQDAEDLLHDGLIVLDRNIRQNKFKGESKLDVYLYSICKYLLFNKNKHNHRITLSDNLSDFDQTIYENPENLFVKEEKRNHLQDILSLLGDHCRQILMMWKLSYSMDEISKKLGLPSNMSARKAKHKCFQTLLQLIKENPEFADLIK